MEGTIHGTNEARWREDRSEHTGLVLGLLYAKNVPVALHKAALEEVLLACWVSLRLDMKPDDADLPTLYLDSDPARASLHNWLLVLVEAWAALRAPQPLAPRSGPAAATARHVIQFVLGLPAEARSQLRTSAGLTSSN